MKDRHAEDLKAAEKSDFLSRLQREILVAEIDGIITNDERRAIYDAIEGPRREANDRAFGALESGMKRMKARLRSVKTDIKKAKTAVKKLKA